jgi:hypothetical protein
VPRCERRGIQHIDLPIWKEHFALPSRVEKKAAGLALSPSVKHPTLWPPCRDWSNLPSVVTEVPKPMVMITILLSQIPLPRNASRQKPPAGGEKATVFPQAITRDPSACLLVQERTSASASASAASASWLSRPTSPNHGVLFNGGAISSGVMLWRERDQIGWCCTAVRCSAVLYTARIAGW